MVDGRDPRPSIAQAPPTSRLGPAPQRSLARSPLSPRVGPDLQFNLGLPVAKLVFLMRET